MPQFAKLGKDCITKGVVLPITSTLNSHLVTISPSFANMVYVTVVVPNSNLIPGLCDPFTRTNSSAPVGVTLGIFHVASPLLWLKSFTMEILPGHDIATTKRNFRVSENKQRCISN